MRNETKEYRSYLEKRLQKNYKDIIALIKLGILEFKSYHNHEQALLFFDKAILLDPICIEAKFWKAMCLYYDFAEYEKAEEVLKEALKLNPNHPESLSLLGWVERGLNRPLDKAIEYVRKAINSKPDWPMLRCQLATFLNAVGNNNEAKKEIDKMFEIPTLDASNITNEIDDYYENLVTGRSWSEQDKENCNVVKKLKDEVQN